ncbi:MAG: DUF371 domain-containing protein [Candidatus Woesearchaeota archaeon]
MNSYSFYCYGHKNITSKHKNTLEFTKDHKVSLQGDCIVGVKADFELDKIRKFIAYKKDIQVIIECEGITQIVNCKINKNFNSDDEIVIRKSGFDSERTLGLWADKGACDLSRELIEKIKKEICFKIILNKNAEDDI